MEQPTPSQVMTPEVVRACGVYLAAKAYAETVREDVGEVQRQVLRELNSPPAPEYVKRGCDAAPILDPSRAYLLPEPMFYRYHSEYQERIRRGGKWSDVPEDHCPALVAENLASDAERVVVDLTAPLFGLSAHALLCAGLEKYRKWVELHVQMAIQSPHWTSPLETLKA